MNIGVFISICLYFILDTIDGVDDKQYDMEQMSGIDALLYKSYKVLLLSKVRTKVEVNLGK